jgi:hypothetical protein
MWPVSVRDGEAAGAYILQLVGRGAVPRDSDHKLSALVDIVKNDFPYSTLIVSPYCDLAQHAAEAARSYKPFSPAPFSAITPQVVRVFVYSGMSFITATDIKHMVVKRDGAVIQPLTPQLT